MFGWNIQFICTKWSQIITLTLDTLQEYSTRRLAYYLGANLVSKVNAHAGDAFYSKPYLSKSLIASSNYGGALDII